MSALRFLIIVLCLLALTNCQNSGDITYKTPKNDSGSNSNPPATGNGQLSNGFGNGVDQPVADDQGKDIEYPFLEYTASGNLKSLEDNFIMLDSNYRLDAKEIHITVTRFRSKDGDIDKEVKNNTGVTDVERTPPEQMKQWVDFGFNNLGFVMYGKSSIRRDRNGAPKTSLVFSQPLPIVIVPSQLVRFDSLKSGPVKYDGVVVTDLADNSNFTVNIQIEELKREGDLITIKVTSVIPEDKNGKLYDKFILPYESTYTIDTKEKRIPKYSIFNYYYNRKKGRKSLTLNHELCKSETTDKKLDFPCVRR